MENNLSKSLEKQINLPILISGENNFKIKLNFSTMKNIQFYGKSFYIYNTYFISLLSPFFSVLTNSRYDQKNLDRQIIDFLTKEGFEYSGSRSLN
jgi:hypothetical protein